MQTETHAGCRVIPDRDDRRPKPTNDLRQLEQLANEAADLGFNDPYASALDFVRVLRRMAQDMG